MTEALEKEARAQFERMLRDARAGKRASGYDVLGKTLDQLAIVSLSRSPAKQERRDT